VIVLDASAAAEWLLGRPNADAVAARLSDPGETLHAPHLITIEVAQVVRRQVLAGSVSANRGAEALQDLVDLDLATYPHEPLLSRIWQLRDKVTAYDAAYLALAEVLDAPLLTLDARLARAGASQARFELVGV